MPGSPFFAAFEYGTVLAVIEAGPTEKMVESARAKDVIRPAPAVHGVRAPIPKQIVRPVPPGNHIVARPSHDHVNAVAPSDHVVVAGSLDPFDALDRVVALSTSGLCAKIHLHSPCRVLEVENITPVTGAPDYSVVPRPGEEVVFLSAPHEHIVSRGTVKRASSRLWGGSPFEEEVIAVTSVDLVIAAPAGDAVAAGTAIKEVWELIAVVKRTRRPVPT